MSFEKKDWKYGDTIAADELNRMEDGIEEALNKNCGYECVGTPEQLLFNETVTIG